MDLMDPMDPLDPLDLMNLPAPIDLHRDCTSESGYAILALLPQRIAGPSGQDASVMDESSTPLYRSVHARDDRP
jgi:hypothetical protein